MNFCTECEKTKRKTAKYDAAVKIMTFEITQKYDLYNRVFWENENYIFPI
jgi:hypothetical protein